MLISTLMSNLFRHIHILRRPVLIVAVLFAVIAGTEGCSRGSARYASVFARVDSLAENEQADSALSILAEMPSESLNASDRALHALLTVKATDKAFITHTSDSIISVALSRFSHRGPKLLRAETVYYHGRVLSDLCDYAAALDAYDEALAILGVDSSPEALHLKGLILSQNAQLFEALRLYSEAILFYKAASDLSLAAGDTTNYFQNQDQIIFDLIHLNRIEEADSVFNRVLTLKSALTSDRQASLEITRRYLALQKGDYREASTGIDTLLAKIPPRFRNFGFMVATRTYQGIGMRDSADFYAGMLKNQESSSNKTTAYFTLLRNRLIHSGDITAQHLLTSFDSITDSLVSTKKS